MGNWFSCLSLLWPTDTTKKVFLVWVGGGLVGYGCIPKWCQSLSSFYQYSFHTFGFPFFNEIREMGLKMVVNLAINQLMYCNRSPQETFELYFYIYIKGKIKQFKTYLIFKIKIFFFYHRFKVNGINKRILLLSNDQYYRTRWITDTRPRLDSYLSNSRWVTGFPPYLYSD